MIPRAAESVVMALGARKSQFTLFPPSKDSSARISLPE